MAKSRSTLLFLLLPFFLIASSCESTRKASSAKKQYKNIYLDQFKLTYFRQLLLKSYNHSGAIQAIIAADHSGFTESILSDEDLKLIDSLTSIDNNRIVADSAQGNQRVEGAKGKRPLGYIMHKLQSKWLDSLARQRLSVNRQKLGWAY